MDLCIAFGEPSPERFVESITADELKDWLDYVCERGLPSHVSRQLASFQAYYLTAHGAKNKDPSDFMLVRKSVTKGNLRQRLKQNLSVIGSAIKARGTSKRR